MLPESPLASLLRRCFAETLSSFDLAARVEDRVRALGLAGEITVVALGKSAATMLAGAMRVVKPRCALVARPSRSRGLDDDLRALIPTPVEFVTSHPLPDEASVRAAEAIRAAISASAPSSTVLVLLSGGASASMCLPRGGLSLDDYRAAVHTLLASGAPIEAVNAVRARLDATKRGGLAGMAGSRTVHTIIAADVLGDDAVVARAVGSGPTVAAEDDALDASLLALLSPHAARIARETSSSPERANHAVHIVARPDDLALAFATRLVAHGFVVTRGADARGSLDAVADRYRAIARTIAPGHAHVAVGEPTVALPANPGRGGRAGRLALVLARDLGDAVFLAGASDGVDGESGHAGAVIDSHFAANAHATNIDLDRAIEAFDDASIHERLGSALDVAPTGLNLLDVHVIARPG